MAVIKTDTFTVSSNEALESHTSDSGGGWQGSEDVHFDVIDGSPDAVFADTANVVTAIGDEDPSVTDYTVEIEGVIGGTATTDRCGLLLRSGGGATQSASTSSYYFLRVTGNTLTNMTWDFYRVDSGSPTTSGISGTTTGTLANLDTDDTFKLRATISGTGATVTILCEYDENIDGGGYGGFSTLTTLSDTHANRIVTAGNVGIYMRGTNASILDFSATHSGVQITDVNTTESWADGDTGLVISGTGFV